MKQSEGTEPERFRKLVTLFHQLHEKREAERARSSKKRAHPIRTWRPNSSECSTKSMPSKAFWKTLLSALSGQG